MIDGLLLLTGVLLGLGSAALPSLAWMIMASVSAMVVLFTPLRRCAIASRAGAVARRPRAWRGAAPGTGCRCACQHPRRTERVLLEGRILSVPAREGAEMHFDVTGTLVDGPDTRVRTARLVWRDARLRPARR